MKTPSNQTPSTGHERADNAWHLIFNAQTWSFAVKNLARNIKRNIATASAIALGFGGFLMLSGFYNWSFSLIDAFFVYGYPLGHVSIFHHDGKDRSIADPKHYALTLEDQKLLVNAIGTDPDVEVHGGKLIRSGLINNGCDSFPFVAMGMDPQLFNHLRNHPNAVELFGSVRLPLKGRSLTEYPPDIGAIAVAPGLFRAMKKSKVYDDYPAHSAISGLIDCSSKKPTDLMDDEPGVQLISSSVLGTISVVDAQLAAVYYSSFSETENTAVVAPLTLLQQLFRDDHVSYYMLWLSHPQHIDEVIARLKQSLGQDASRFDIFRFNDPSFSKFYTGQRRFTAVLLTFLGIIMTLLVGLSIFNSSTITVIERSREWGMMRAVGFRHDQIASLFVREYLMLSLIAMAFGALAAASAVYFINRAQIPYVPPGIGIPITLMILPSVRGVTACIALVMMITTLATFGALRSIRKHRIITLLEEARR